MILPVTVRFAIVSTSESGAVVRPEVWHDGTLIHAYTEKLIKPGEAALMGPFQTEIDFVPPVVKPA